MNPENSTQGGSPSGSAPCSTFWLFRWHWLNLLWLLAGLLFFGWLIYRTIHDDIKVEGMLLGFILGFWFREGDRWLKGKQDAMRVQILSSNGAAQPPEETP